MQFEAEPGTWTFTATGVLPITAPKPPRAAQPRLTPLNKKGWKAWASVTHTGPTFSYDWGRKQGGSAFDAIDGDYWTCWSTGTRQQAGQWFALDLGRAQTFHKVVLENGWAPYDSPRRYNLYVSDDGETWGQPIATGSGSYSITEITCEPQTKRYLRIEQTGSDSFYWWSIFEVNVY